VSEKDLEALYVEANTFSLASHVFWALWGLIQVVYSSFIFSMFSLVEWCPLLLILFVMMNRQRCPQLNLIILVTFSFDTMSTKDRKRRISCLHEPILQDARMSRWESLLNHLLVFVCHVCSMNPLIHVVYVCLKFHSRRFSE